MRRLFLILCLLPFFAFATPAAAAPKFCFPQVPDCITFRFATFWRDNGGLSVFGLPLSPAANEQVGDQKYKVQYFERARFEYHKGDPLPYDMLLGRIGADQLAAQGRDWQTFPKADAGAPHYFAASGHAIAPQFWSFWSSNGLEFDGNKKAKSMAESLALFGVPISEAQMEPGADGQQYLTQWFERAKFEYHPENKPPYDVLLARLGADALQHRPAQIKPAKTPAPAISQAIGCPPNAPPAAEGAQAWMGIAEPNAPDLDNAVCVRLTVNGAPVQGAQASAVVHFSTGDRNFGPATTGADGQAQIDFNIAKAKHKFVVAVDVTIVAPDGRAYTTATNFRPRYSLEEPPPPSGAVLPNIPAPTGNCAANAPAPIEGAQAWMTDIQPSDPNQFDSVCARLIVNGAVVSGASVEAISYRYGKDRQYGPATTDANGVAELGFMVDNARNRYIVYIDVSLHAHGKDYAATTFYRPNYPNAP